jgi:thioredoxin reductase (NADPH)
MEKEFLQRMTRNAADLLMEMIAIPSTSFNEGKVADFLFARLGERAGRLNDRHKATGKSGEIVVENFQTGQTEVLPCDGVFVAIGRQPETELVKDHLPLDEQGYILAGESTATAIPGVYAVGDVRTKALRQIITAAADGANAAYQAEEYLASK